MPQLGETVTEGTITRWLKNVGDHVEADEPLFEVSTDKVDSEVPAPASGTLSEILVQEGETAEVGTRLAVIADGAGGAAAGAAPAREPVTPPPAAPGPTPPRRAREPGTPPAAPAAPAPTPPPRAREPVTPPPAAAAPAATPPPRAREPVTPPPSSAPAPAPAVGPPTGGQLMSPVVRRLLGEYGLDASEVQGTGEGGRITRNDVL